MKNGRIHKSAAAFTAIIAVILLSGCGNTTAGGPSAFNDLRSGTAAYLSTYNGYFISRPIAEKTEALPVMAAYSSFSSQNSDAAIITAAIVIVLTIICIIFMVAVISMSGSSYRRDISDRNPPKLPPPSYPAGAVSILSGRMAGSSISIFNGENLVIGREPKYSGLVLDYGYISRKHCTITYDARNRVYFVVDHRTKNGTYTLDGSRLTPENAVMLKAGTTIYLGDRNCLIMLK